MAAPAPLTNPVLTATLAAGFTRARDYGSALLKQGKPWTEVVDRNAFSKPGNVSEAFTRLKKNASYFRMNYLIVMIITCAVTFIMHPSSLFVLGLLIGGWIYVLLIRQAPLSISGRVLSEREKLLGMSAISFVTIFFLTSVGTVLFSALSISLAVVTLHGAFRQPDELFGVDEVENTNNNSILNIFSVPAQPAGPANV